MISIDDANLRDRVSVCLEKLQVDPPDAGNEPRFSVDGDEDEDSE